MNPTESFLVLLLAGLATAIALGAIEVAPAILHSSVSQAFLLVMTLVLFAYSPVVGIAAIALFTILMFKRNVQKTTQYTEVVQQFTKDAAAQQAYQPAPVAPVPPSLRETFAANGLEGYATPEQVGTYPLEDRPQTQASQTFTAMYRPTEDMGDNSFLPTPSFLDDYKTQAFAY
jgi:type II secretory pathway pseudopilin PulG